MLGNNLKFYVDYNNGLSIAQDSKKYYDKFAVEGLEIENNRTLHAKIFVFHTLKGDWTLFGSPNFTEPALLRAVSQAGNLEAAMLIPPSEQWSWKELYTGKVKPVSITWGQLECSEKPKEDPINLLVEQWGYQTPSNEAIIFSRGLKDGTKVFVRLIGADKLIEVTVTNGVIKFKVPVDWESESRYEVLDQEMKILVKGFLNRSGAIMRSLPDIDIDDESKIRIWFFLNQLQNFSVKDYGSAKLSRRSFI